MMITGTGTGMMMMDSDGRGETLIIAGWDQ